MPSIWEGYWDIGLIFVAHAWISNKNEVVHIFIGICIFYCGMHIWGKVRAREG